jgi:hypothetical protein
MEKNRNFRGETFFGKKTITTTICGHSTASEYRHLFYHLMYL